MSDRLKELQRQRALMQEQLNWLDREIAAEAGRAPAAPAPAPVTKTPEAAPAPVEAMAEQIMAQYQNEPQAVRSNVKRGCFIYVFAAGGLIAIGLLVLYLYSVRK